MSKELPGELAALVDTVFAAYNSKNFDLLKSVYGDDIVIIDGFAPFRWIGANALTKWWADAEQWLKAGGVAKEELVSKGTLAWGVSGDRAYVSTAAVLTITLQKGEPIIRPGTLVLTFAKRTDGSWKAEGHTWARSS